MERIRIGDIELRPMKNNDTSYLAEIVKWYPNEHYGHESDYDISETDPDVYIPKGGTGAYCIHKSCFEKPEVCYVVAFVCGNEDPDILSVGSRPWELNARDRKHFNEVVKCMFEHYHNEDNND